MHLVIALHTVPPVVIRPPIHARYIREKFPLSCLTRLKEIPQCSLGFVTTFFSSFFCIEFHFWRQNEVSKGDMQMRRSIRMSTWNFFHHYIHIVDSFSAFDTDSSLPPPWVNIDTVSWNSNFTLTLTGPLQWATIAMLPTVSPYNQNKTLLRIWLNL